MLHRLRRDDGTEVTVIGFPAKFSATPASYRCAPPAFAQDTASVLQRTLEFDDETLTRLASKGVLGL
jgi:crotonobetainyl-CoA:carnitine CoA-transferase CaiB-like acyl-CoA transferase